MADYLGRVAPALRAAGIDGWLFYNIYHRDDVADAILGVPGDAMNTRPWAALVRADGSVTRIVHAIEAGVLSHLPGPVATYASRDEFLARLRAACPRRTPVAINYSAAIPALSLVDHGLVELLRQLAIPVLPAETLIQRVLGVLGAAGRASHDRAAIVVRGELHAAWQRLAERIRGGTAVSEGEVRDWISAGFARHGLITEEAPLVAAGTNSNDPHYLPDGAGAPITADQVVQFDLWAREPGADGVYADISWVAYTGPAVPPPVTETFAALCAARDGAVTFIRERLDAGQPVSGAEVDRHTRAILDRHRLLPWVCHRTGHAIDTRLHGIGVNLDSVEFPDPRPLLDGSCFSVEPGAYRPEFGLRTEINAYVQESTLVVSGGAPQQAVLHL
jgi:Xaa-Pro aminopeptidase